MKKQGASLSSTSPLEGEDVGFSRQERGNVLNSAKLPLSVTRRGDISPSRGEIGAKQLKHPSHLVYRNNTFTSGIRILAEETAIAISYNGSTHAVLMATPQDLTDFAVGFSLTEGIISSVEAIENIEIVETPLGMDLQVCLVGDVAAKLAARKRSMAGPVGCGLCGIESLEGAMRQVPLIETYAQFSPEDIADAVAQLSANQPLNAETALCMLQVFLCPAKGCLQCVKMSAGTMRSINWLALWRSKALMQALAQLCLPRVCRLRWCRKPQLRARV
jgi:FdhD/NarQ family